MGVNESEQWSTYEESFCDVSEEFRSRGLDGTTAKKRYTTTTRQKDD